MPAPLFSVVMPAYQASATLAAAAGSVLQQTEGNLELLIVDDSSKDETLEIALGLQAADGRVKVLRPAKNGGVAAARNLAIEAAEGRYISFLDSDDLWYPGKLALQRSAFESGAKVSFGSYVRSAGIYQGVRRARRSVVPRDFLITNPIGNLTGAYCVEAIGKIYQPKVRHEDYVMWYEIVRKAGIAYGIDEVMGVYHVAPGSVSGNKAKAALWHWQALRQSMHIPLAPAVVGFVGYAMYSVAIRMRERLSANGLFSVDRSPSQ
jgi:teichuronic acid biosynthesis glycosyltransferase TuaG